MKTFLLDIIPKLKSYSQSLDTLSTLTKQSWVWLGEDNEKKVVYIFGGDGKLIISVNGKVNFGSWEILGENTIILNTGHDTYLFNHGFVDDSFLALQLDGSSEYAILINKKLYEAGWTTIESVLTWSNNTYLNKRESKGEIVMDKRLFNVTELNTESGLLKFTTECDSGFAIGDSVTLNGRKAPDGNYRYGWLTSLTVKNGKVVSK